MPKPTQFVEHVLETLAAAFGPVQARAMFGGWGMYHQGVFFALVMDDAFYVKTDAENLALFEAAGLEPVVYEVDGRDPIVMHYRGVPEEALESPAVMAEWARVGYGAALRAAAAKGFKPAKAASSGAKARARPAPAPRARRAAKRRS